MTADIAGVTNSFTPLRGVIGGILIGLSAGVLLLCNGNILGASGIASSLYLRPRKTARDDSQRWKVVFLATFLFASGILSLPQVGLANDTRLLNDESIPVPSVAALILGGFFVSFGTGLGSGCTTGHGVCGMARFSKRSIVAVMTFMVFAMGTAMLTSPTTSFSYAFDFLRTPNHQPIFVPRQLVWVGWILSGIVALWCAYAVARRQPGEERALIDHLGGGTSNGGSSNGASKATGDSSAAQEKPASSNGGRAGGGDVDEEAASNTTGSQTGDAAEVQHNGSSGAAAATTSRPVHPNQRLAYAGLAGILFSAGLAVSGMNLQSKNFAFLDLMTISQGLWDPTLLCVMAAAVMTSCASYQLVPGYSLFNNDKVAVKCPLSGGKYDVPNKTHIDAPLIGGAVCFGVGWGISGLCPGPGLFMSAAGIQSVFYCYLPAYVLGGYVANFVKERMA